MHVLKTKIHTIAIQKITEKTWRRWRGYLLALSPFGNWKAGGISLCSLSLSGCWRSQSTDAERKREREQGKEREWESGREGALGFLMQSRQGLNTYQPSVFVLRWGWALPKWGCRVRPPFVSFYVPSTWTRTFIHTVIVAILWFKKMNCH